jgi:hypothetical protein
MSISSNLDIINKQYQDILIIPLGLDRYFHILSVRPSTLKQSQCTVGNCGVFPILDRWWNDELE